MAAQIGCWLNLTGQAAGAAQDEGRVLQSDHQASSFIHAISQPLNVIRLTADNAEHYVRTNLTGAEAAYLSGKLERIRQQLDKAADLIESARAGSAADGQD